ncbi:MAG: hypothetical protein LBC50_00390 [Candidatus Ancillula sp.]|jgi:hypothetical protein|nr:hypothetical protein [Candidatus Ancillula sp.]
MKSKYEHVNVLYTESQAYDEYDIDYTEQEPVTLSLPHSFVSSMCLYISEALSNTRKIDVLAKWMKPYVYNHIDELRLKGYGFGMRPKLLSVTVKRLNSRKAYGVCSIETSTGRHLISITYEVQHLSWIATNIDVVTEDSSKIICLVSKI